MKGPNAFAYDRVVVGETLIMADIFGPGRAVIAFDPEFGIRQVAKQRPAARSVPASDLPTLGHGGQERVSVLFGYPIFYSEEERAGAAQNGNRRIGVVDVHQGHRRERR